MILSFTIIWQKRTCFEIYHDTEHNLNFMRVCGWNLPNRHSLFYFLFLLFFAYSWLFFSFFSIVEAFELQPANSWRGVFSVSSYTQYFNVDTDLVLNRLLGSLHPIGGDFFTKIDANPDLWVLIFITGHCYWFCILHLGCNLVSIIGDMYSWVS